MWGNEWWRGDGWPTAEEWSAFWAALSVLFAAVAAFAALAAVYIAFHQLRLVVRSNDTLTAANRETAESNLALYRPYVVVDIDVRKREMSKKVAYVDGTITVRVRNTGRTTARDVMLQVSPEFRSSGAKYSDEASNIEVMAKLNQNFGGEIVFKTLAPGASFSYALDTIRGYLETKDELPSLYEVTTSYNTMDESHSFTESYELNLEALGPTILETDSLRRISRDLKDLTEAINELK